VSEIVIELSLDDGDAIPGHAAGWLGEFGGRASP
jgi:hypothetical protein